MKVTLTNLEDLRGKDEGTILDFFYNLFITYGRIYGPFIRPDSDNTDRRIYIRIYYDTENNHYDYYYIWINDIQIDLESGNLDYVYDVENNKEKFNEWFKRHKLDHMWLDKDFYKLPKIDIFD